jgi:hypothetical protein
MGQPPLPIFTISRRAQYIIESDVGEEILQAPKLGFQESVPWQPRGDLRQEHGFSFNGRESSGGKTVGSRFVKYNP